MYNSKQSINIEYLKEAKNLQELKKLYYKLCMQYHPDRPTGDLEIMQKINNEYDYLKTVLKNATPKNEEEKKQYKETSESMEGFKEILNKLMRYKNIVFEIVGSWLWISGNGTFGIKQEILYDELKCGYSRPNKKFYWYNGINCINGKPESKCRGGHLQDAINKFGIIKMESEGSPLLV